MNEQEKRLRETYPHQYVESKKEDNKWGFIFLIIVSMLSLFVYGYFIGESNDKIIELEGELEFKENMLQIANTELDLNNVLIADKTTEIIKLDFEIIRMLEHKIQSEINLSLCQYKLQSLENG